MMFFDDIQTRSEQANNKIYGVVVGIVTNNKDPEGLGRVKLNFPWRDCEQESYWARIATMMAGNERGTYFLPDVEDEVLVAFERGDINEPYVLGVLWNGKDKPPADNSDGKNSIKKIKSKSGHEVVFSDEDGKEKVEIKSKAGHTIVLDDASGSEKIEIKDKSGSNSVVIDSAQNGITIESSSILKLKSQMIEIESGGMMKIKAGAVLTIEGSLVKIN